MNVTIKDIARKLGVSYSSVSRALNGKEGVSEDTRQQIIEAADQMGYQPNDLARGLVNKVSNTIGVIIPDINNPFYGEIVTGIMDASKESDYDVFLCVSDYNLDIEKEYLDTLRKKRVDGIILKSMGNVQKERYDSISIPIMIIERYEEEVKHPSVEVDNIEGGYQAARHLIECGYRHPAFLLGAAENITSQQRLNGAKKALAEYGIPFQDEQVIYTGFSIEGGKKAAREIFERRLVIDSLFGMSDLIALGALQFCSETGRKVPEEVGIIGYDDISYAGLPQIQLTTIRQPKQELGRLLMETLVAEIQNKKNEVPKSQNPVHIILTPELVARKTTAKIE